MDRLEDETESVSNKIMEYFQEIKQNPRLRI